MAWSLGRAVLLAALAAWSEPPPLPSIPLASFTPAIRTQIEAAYRRAARQERGRVRGRASKRPDVRRGPLRPRARGKRPRQGGAGGRALPQGVRALARVRLGALRAGGRVSRPGRFGPGAGGARALP